MAAGFSDETPPVDVPRRSEDQLAQANHLLHHLRTQLAELDRREQELNQQLSTVLREQQLAQETTRKRQSELQHVQSLLDARDLRLDKREDDLARCEKEALSKLDQRTRTIDELEAATRLRLDELEEAAQSTASHEREKLTVELKSQRAAWEAEVTRRETALRESELGMATRLEALEREKLAELAQRELTVTTRLDELEQTVFSETNSQRARIEQEQRQREAAWADRDAAIALAEQALERQQREFNAEQERLRTALNTELAHEQSALSLLRSELESARQQHEEFTTQWAAERERCAAEQHLELEQLRKAKLAALDQREQELERREVNSEKRARFHEQHLEKVRTELTVERAEQERQRQQHRVWVEQVETSIRKRLAHMRRFRDLLTQREESLAAEHQILHVARQEQETRLRQDREALEADRAAFAQERDATRHHFTQQQVRLDTLEVVQQVQRRSLQILGSELSTTLEEMSERRVSVDDAWSHFVYAGDTPAAQQQLIRARQEFSDQFRSMQELLAVQQRELHQSLVALDEQRSDISDEGTRLADWFNQRESDLANRESEVRHRYADLAHMQTHLQAERDQWQQDRLSAERVIRELVQQLEETLSEIAELQSSVPKAEFDSTAKAA